GAMYILSYFRKHWRGPVLFLLCAAICGAVFYLYGLPAESVLYAAALCLVPCLGFLIVDIVSYSRRVRALRELLRNIRVSIERLPEPRDGVEGAYDALLRELWDEKSKLDAEYSASRREAEDYYAMWAHQIKTPIAAMRLLLQQGAEPDGAAVSAELFRIEQYVEMVLSYQRLGSDTVDLVLRRVELGRVVRGCVRKFAGLFIMKKLPLELGEVGLEVLTDEKWLAFVIEQLLSNALKHPGGQHKYPRRRPQPCHRGYRHGHSAGGSSPPG
uniref:sensor histidine kinase n=1 Tax=Candidatus Scatomorpha intestinigallinarum TaxID=2840923 RepID=UPI0040287315